jgi:hypothetical protein
LQPDAVGLGQGQRFRQQHDRHQARRSRHARFDVADRPGAQTGAFGQRLLRQVRRRPEGLKQLG